jgi:hypothetical protein
MLDTNDDQVLHDLGCSNGHMIFDGTLVQYVGGVVARERERLARVFDKQFPEIAAAIRDDSMDAHVFKWEPMMKGLDVPPRTFTQREKDKRAKAASQDGK